MIVPDKGVINVAMIWAGWLIGQQLLILFPPHCFSLIRTLLDAPALKNC